MSHLLSRRHRLGRAWLCLALLLSLLALATDVHTQPPPGRPPTGNVALLRGNVDFYLTVHLLTGFPLAAAIMAWSMWYGARRLLGSIRSLT